MVSNLTTAQAAAEIMALINARPQSPRQEEIEAIVARVAPSLGASVPAIACSPLHKEVARVAGEYGKACVAFDRSNDDDDAMQALAEWDAAVRSYLAQPKGTPDEVYYRLDKAMQAKCEAIWAKPVRNLADLYVRIAMAVHWNSPLLISDPPYPVDVLADDPDTYTDARSLAFLVRGLLDITGLRFDQDGRLLSTEACNV